MFSTPLSRRDALRAAAVGSLGFVLGPVARATAAGNFRGRPNIVLIMTDDAGFSDPGCYGGEMPTPHIDRLAAEGARFRRFCTNARCSPTRASLLTGRYAHRVGVGELAGGWYRTEFPAYRGHMDTTVPTLPQVLQRHGYHTLMSGKWHLGGTDGFGNATIPEAELAKWPLQRGFDRFFGLLEGELDYFKPKDWRQYCLENEKFLVNDLDDFYATDYITRYALQYIDEVRTVDDAPFFLYVPYSAPHHPYQAPADRVDAMRPIYEPGRRALYHQRVERLRELGLLDPAASPQPLPADTDWLKEEEWKQGMATIAAMTSIADDGVGALRAKLESLGELDNTIFIYLSDNGPVRYGDAGIQNTPFRGRKGNLYEGGVQTHCIVRWPQRVKAGDWLDEAGHVMDWMPTLLEAAGVDPRHAVSDAFPEMDGRSMLPAFAGRAMPKRQLFWDLYGYQAAREGRWKWLSDPEGRQHLFDLDADPCETRNILDEQASIAHRLASAHAGWADAVGVVPYDRFIEAQDRQRRLIRPDYQRK